MAYHYTDHNHNRDLAYRFSRDTRHHHQHHQHQHHPTQYIVNDGNMIIDEKSLRHSNAIIYNGSGSTMWVKPTRHASSSSSSHGTTSWTTTPAMPTCRGCLGRRELYFGSYCRDCTSARLGAPVDRRRIDCSRDGRRVLDYPERRAVAWR